MSRITIADFVARTQRTTPLSVMLGLQVERLEHGFASVRLPFRGDFVRAGGTIAGPLQMALADYALYGAIMTVAEHGEGAVTSNLNFTFLRRPPQADIIAEARIIRPGRRLIYGEVMIYSDGQPEPVAHATGTYALPTPP